MPHDATNMPFSRSASYRNSFPTAAEANVSDKLDTTLRIENMLLEEFNYVALTAYQAMEDRARVSNLYYVLLGSLVSGLAIIYQFSEGTRTYSQTLLALLLVAMSILSLTFFEKFIRLRQAYRESLICMNMIKEFYIRQFQQQMPEIEQAFRWRLKTIPAGERFGSVTFIMSNLIALVGSVCLALATFMFMEPGLLFNHESILPLPALIALMVFGVLLLLHILYYRRTLSKHSEAAILEKQAKEIGITLPADESVT
ncbi:MAG TPA: hypothetical protein VKR83_00825 [Ktedonobacteraceae bacterium]|nr:hypothetical protein [Ktedonobacteraceae bacterium]